MSSPAARGTGFAGLLLALAVLLALGKVLLPDGLIRPPDWLVQPFADWINAAFYFLQNDLGLMALTRAFSDVVEWLLDVTANLLYGKSRWPNIGPIPWIVIASASRIGSRETSALSSAPLSERSKRARSASWRSHRL